jgi:peptidoglycan/LPS O-acetylase OafA/YrhL
MESNLLTSKKAMSFRNELYGIAAIWIILFHVALYTTPLQVRALSAIDGGWQLIVNKVFRVVRWIFLRGNLGVDIFLFFSSIGLYQSIHNNNINRFYVRRFNRVVIPYLLVAVFYFAWHDFIRFDNGIGQYLLNLTTAELWISGKFPLWYASFIVIMYAIYPVLYKWDEKTKHMSTILIIITWVTFTAFMWYKQIPLYVHCERAVSRFPIFLLGVIAAPHVFKGEGFPIKHWLFIISCLVVLAGFAFIAVFHVPAFLRRYILGGVGIGIIVIWTTLRNRGWFKHIAKPLLFVGAMTFETYLIHVIIKEIIDINEWWSVCPTWLWYVIVLVLTIPLAWCLTKLTDSIKKKFRLA